MIHFAYIPQQVKQQINVMKISILLLAALFIGCSSDKVQVPAPVIQSLPVIALHNIQNHFYRISASIQGAVIWKSALKFLVH